MSQITPQMDRLDSELQMMKELQQESSLVKFTAKPFDYPDQYLVTFDCLGLSGKPDISGPLAKDWRKHGNFPWLRRQHSVLIYLPAGYPDQPPRVILQTPVFHPNMTSQKEIQRRLAQAVQEVGGEEIFQRALEANPELQKQVVSAAQMGVCVDGIIPPNQGGNYHRGIHLRDICVELGQMIMMQRYNLAHGLNNEALEWVKWAEKQSNLLPIDPREFLDLRPVVVQVLQPGEDLENFIVVEENNGG